MNHWKALHYCKYTTDHRTTKTLLCICRFLKTTTTTTTTTTTISVHKTRGWNLWLLPLIAPSTLTFIQNHKQQKQKGTN